MAHEVCRSCQEPLLVQVAFDSDEEDEVMSTGKSAQDQDASQSVIDDVELRCGCHFHWECFLDSSTITECPSCSRDISNLASNGQQQVLVIVRNEGGVQDGYDILPSATEEAYLRAYPEERRGHAFFEFVREGDLDAVVCILKEQEESDEEDQVDEDIEVDVLRYCGTFEGIQGSALHVAIRYQREEIAWLLLALGSGLAWEEFPEGSVQVLNSLGLSKDDRKATPDIRTLKDSENRLPADLAAEVGGVWTKWVESGKLSP